MRNPKSVQIFLATVLGMQHRERLVFKASEGVDKKFGMPCFVEVYYADIKDTVKTNISIKLVDVEGTPVIGKDGKFAGKAVIHNKLKSLFTEDYATQHFGAINPKFLGTEYVEKFGYADVDLEVELPEATNETVAETTEHVEVVQDAPETTEATNESETVAETTAEIAKVIAENVAEMPTKKQGKKKTEKVNA